MPSLRFGRVAPFVSATADGCIGSGARDPTSTVTMGASPSTKRRTISPRRDNKWAFTQSTAKRFGARSFKAPLLSTACRGRTQVLKCSPGSSSSSARTQRAHNELSSTLLFSRGTAVKVGAWLRSGGREKRGSKSIRSLGLFGGELLTPEGPLLTLHALFSERSGGRADHHETHLSAQQTPPQTRHRLPRPHEDHGW